MGETTELPRAERRRQLAGNTALGAGLAIFALAAAASGWWRAEDLNLAAASYRDVIMRTGYAIALVLVLVGAFERINRATRGALYKLASEAAATRAAIQVIALHLPDAIELADWRGFNTAVREGLAPAAGGEGPTRTFRLIPGTRKL